MVGRITPLKTPCSCQYYREYHRATISISLINCKIRCFNLNIVSEMVTICTIWTISTRVAAEYGECVVTLVEELNQNSRVNYCESRGYHAMQCFHGSRCDSAGPAAFWLPISLADLSLWSSGCVGQKERRGPLLSDILSSEFAPPLNRA